MPAKKREESKYKSFVGRIFSLRKHREIPCFINNKDKIDLNLSEFGDAVLIIDETNTRVKVTLVDGSFIWIPKFFLHQEIPNKTFKEIDTITACISELLLLANCLKNKSQDFNDCSSYAPKLEQLANTLRFHADEINPTKAKKSNVS